METVELKGKNQNVAIGYPNPVAVNVNLGSNSNDSIDYNKEKEKIYHLKRMDPSPHLMMDISLNNSNGYLYETIIKEIGCPVGFIPHYICRKTSGKIEKNALLDEIYRAAEHGIAWFVLHLTPNTYLVDLAIKKRKFPFASRSAIIEIEDMMLNNRNRSIYWEVFDEIINICKKYSIAISLGASFRPGITHYALDEVHLAELRQYSEISSILKSNGVKYFVEGIGHCNVRKIIEFNKIINNLDCPFMPLGPLFSDDFNNDDHIISAMSFYAGVVLGGKYSVINSITSVEHSGGIPTIEEMTIGFKMAISCAKLCNNFFGIEDNSRINNHCVNSLGLNCSRCNEICPNNFYYKYKKQIQQWISST